MPIDKWVQDQHQKGAKFRDLDTAQHELPKGTIHGNRVSQCTSAIIADFVGFTNEEAIDPK